MSNRFTAFLTTGRPSSAALWLFVTIVATEIAVGQCFGTALVLVHDNADAWLCHQGAKDNENNGDGFDHSNGIGGAVR